MAKSGHSDTTLYVVSCDDADALFAVYADSRREANLQVANMIKYYDELDGGDVSVPASIQRVIDLRSNMKRKVRIGVMLKSEPQFPVEGSGMIYSLTGD